MSAGLTTLLVFGVVLVIAGLVAIVKAQSIADWNNNLKNPGFRGTTPNTRGTWIRLGVLLFAVGVGSIILPITRH